MRPFVGSWCRAQISQPLSASKVAVVFLSAASPWYAYNVRRLKLDNVTIDGKRHDTELSTS